MNRRKDTGNIIIRLIKSFKHAVDGVIYSLENEFNLLIMMFISLVTLIISFILNISNIELIIIVLCIGLTLTVELINTCIEATIDLITLKDNKLAKIAKDSSSGASLIISFISLVIGLIIFIPKIMERFF
jgi:diacylglycerol kinase